VFEIPGEVCHQLGVDPHHPGLKDHELGFQQLDPFAEVNNKFALLGR
jgi:hypothetical protein